MPDLSAHFKENYHMTKNEMARVIVQALYATTMLPTSDHPEVMRRVKHGTIASLTRHHKLACDALRSVNPIAARNHSMDDRWQTVQLNELKDAQRLASRLLKRHCDFRFTNSRPKLGYLISFTTAIDFEKDRALFDGLLYSLAPNPEEREPMRVVIARANNQMVI
jgi:hypothetical protein